MSTLVRPVADNDCHMSTSPYFADSRTAGELASAAPHNSYIRDGNESGPLSRRPTSKLRCLRRRGRTKAKRRN